MTKFKKYYSDIKVIGSGNFAKVYLVERKTTKERFAVKVFDKEIMEIDKVERECI